jgi:hypothetical protein
MKPGGSLWLFTQKKSQPVENVTPAQGLRFRQALPFRAPVEFGIS